MRGKVYTTPPMLFIYRITPAYAGKRVDVPKRKTYEEDHPRLCGEKVRFGLTLDKIQGSPPPMRGKAFCDRHSGN